MKSTKTPLMRILHNLSIQSKKASFDANHQTAYSRRDFIETTAKATAVIGIASTLPFLTSCKSLQKENNTTESTNTNLKKYNIAIIGGGIAGLHACHVLKKNGIDATVYEGSNRTGGRNGEANKLKIKLITY